MSFGKAVITPLPPVRDVTSSGLSKESSEQGRVKREVYLLYLQSASKIGCLFFILTTILSQVVPIMATYMLQLGVKVTA
ncbi:hypothetical protein L210DRAFT_1005230, partial [Boletus edulis BED1]